MSERRRRRVRKNSGSEEDDKPATSDMSDPEYESAADEDVHDSDSEDRGSEEGGEEQLYPKDEQGNETKGVEGEERAPGDGQESSGVKQDKVSVDEDRRNPAYIPKRGLFYEHDDRLESGDEEEGEEEGEEGTEDKPMAADGEEKKESKKEKDGTTTSTKPGDAKEKPRRVYKADVAEKWGHDKFMELDQTPKSKDELISVYGYDIRNEDNAPRARRRRRYGRGPNKYTRNWEDEEAYQSKTAVRGGPGAPPLRGGGGGGGRRRPEEGGDPEKEPQRSERRPQGQQGSENQGRYREDRDRDFEYSDRGHRGGGRGGGRGRGSRGDQNRRDQGSDRPRGNQGSRRLVDQAVEAKLDNLENEMSKVNIGNNRRNDNDHRQGGQGRQHQGDHQGEGRPKRYSNLRPGRDNHPQHVDGRQHQNFYEYQQQHPDQQGGPMGFGSQAFPNTPNNGPPPDAPFLTSAPTGGPRMAIPAPTAGGAPYINPAGGMINYGPPPPVPYAGVPVTVPIPLVGVPAAPHHPPADPLAIMAAASHLNQVQTLMANSGVAVSTPDQVLLAAAAAQGGQGYAEVRGGVTYFNPTAQPPASMRSQVSKRPKAAIPIVDPSQVEGNRQTIEDSTVQDGQGLMQIQAEPLATHPTTA